MKSLIVASLLLVAGFSYADSKRCLQTGLVTPEGIAQSGKLCISMQDMKVVGQGEEGNIRLSLFDNDGTSLGVNDFNYAVKASVGARTGTSFIRNLGDEPSVTVLEDVDQAGREKSSAVGIVEIGKRSFVILKDQSL